MSRPLSIVPVSRRMFLQSGALGLFGFFIARRTDASPVRQMSSSATLDRIGSQMTIIRRSAWTSIGPNTERMHAAQPYTRITVHHEGTRTFRYTSRRRTATELSRVLESHQEHRFGDIAYHLIVDYAGRVWEGRSLSYEGAHVSSANEGNIGVMLLGNFERQYPSAAQLASLDDLLGILRRQYGLSTARVYGHRDLRRTLCPGDRLYPAIEEIKRYG